MGAMGAMAQQSLANTPALAESSNVVVTQHQNRNPQRLDECELSIVQLMVGDDLGNSILGSTLRER